MWTVATRKDGKVWLIFFYTRTQNGKSDLVLVTLIHCEYRCVPARLCSEITPRLLSFTFGVKGNGDRHVVGVY